MSELKKKVIAGIIAVEGGYVDDARDSGGETKYGITLTTARAYGYKGDMKDLPESLAYEIYGRMYWDAIRLDVIESFSPLIAQEMADTGVNMGTGRAVMFLQRALNVLNANGNHYNDLKVDGKIGITTLSAFKAYMVRHGVRGEKVLYAMLNSLQGAFYVELAERRQKDEAFIFGWFFHRVVS